MEIYEAAEATAAKIEERGWIRGQYEDDCGHVCLLGAMKYVFKMDMPAENKFYHVVADHLGSVPQMWNDCVARSQDDVVAMLREVADKYRPDEMNSEAD